MTEFPEERIKEKEGWLCPRCERVNAPFVRTCDCVDANNTIYGQQFPMYIKLCCSGYPNCIHMLGQSDKFNKKTDLSNAVREKK